MTADKGAVSQRDGNYNVSAEGGMIGMQKELEWQGSIRLKTEVNIENKIITIRKISVSITKNQWITLVWEHNLRLI